jgi:hypothetical protein
MNVAVKNASRFGRQPVVRNGVIKKKPPRALTELDWKVLDAFRRYRLLSADYLAALVDSSPKYMTTLIQVLKSEPQCYIKLCEEQASNPRYYLHTPLYYELDAPGITQLQERGFTLPSRKPVKNFVHQVMVDQIMASFQIGAVDGVTLIPREEVLSNPKTPEATRALKHPEAIPLPGKATRYYRPDGSLFVLKNDHFHFIPGIEADCGTEPIQTYDYDRSSISAKFDDIITILDNDIHHRHFGASSFFVPFFTTTQRRMKSMMDLWEQKTAHRPSYRKSVLFKTHPIFTSADKGRPTGHAITEPYQRVGYPPFSFV